MNFKNKPIKIIAIVFLNLVTNYAYSQSEQHSHKYKIGLGGLYFGDGDYTFAASFNKIFENKNELAFPVNYFKWFNSHKTATAQDITIGIAFNYTPFKKDRKLNVYLTSEFNFNYYSNNFSGLFQTPTNNTLKRYGPNLYLGIIISYKISKRLSFQFEYKMGEGYQKGNIYDCRKSGLIENCSYIPQNGWFLKVLGGPKIFYHFK